MTGWNTRTTRSPGPWCGGPPGRRRGLRPCTRTAGPPGWDRCRPARTLADPGWSGVSLRPASALALAVYLRARRNHVLADCDWVWLGTRGCGRGRGRFGNTGIRKMLIRRAEQTGYAGVTPHQFRHTFSDAWLKSGGSEGDLMHLNGWRSRQMVDRYASDVADQRALEGRHDLTGGSGLILSE